MSFTQPTGEELAVDIMLRYDPRHPQIRLTILSHLLGQVAPDVDNPEPFYTMLDKLTNFVGEGYESFQEELRLFKPQPVEEDDDVRNGYEELGLIGEQHERGGAYL